MLSKNSTGQINLEQFIPYAQGFVFNPLPKLLYPLLVADFQLLVLLWAIQRAKQLQEFSGSYSVIPQRENKLSASIQMTWHTENNQFSFSSFLKKKNGPVLLVLWGKKSLQLFFLGGERLAAKTRCLNNTGN